MSVEADSARELTAFVLDEYIRERVTTLRVLRAIPVGRESYAPDDRSMSALKLARHIAHSELFFLQGAAAGSLPKFESPEHDLAELCARYEAAFAEPLDRVRTLSGDELLRTVKLGPRELTVFELLHFMLKHSIHHRGQLSAYLRPMGASVPSIYGPSGDTK
jgi:uncharacterized damage-inducible protein DinB